MSDELNLQTIPFRGPVRSKIIREDFTNIQNQFNLLRSEFLARVSATASEITAARDNFSSLVNRNVAVGKAGFNSWVSGGAVSGTGGRSVSIDAGKAIVGGIGCSFGTGSGSPAINADIFQTSAVVVNADNSRSIIDFHDPDVEPYPEIASSQKMLAVLKVTPGGTVGKIVDRRYDKDITVSNIRYSHVWDLYDDSFVRTGKDTIRLDFNAGDLYKADLGSWDGSGTAVTFSLANPKRGAVTLRLNHAAQALSVQFAAAAVSAQFHHVNVDYSGTAEKYILPSGTAKKTLFQIYSEYDDDNARWEFYVARNPFYKVI